MASSLAKVASLLLLNAISGKYVSASNVTSPTNASSSACSRLAAKYPGSTYLPGSGAYANATLENWSLNCVLDSYCIFEPTCTQEVSEALAILKQTNTNFAVRSGGHMPIPGAASIEDGVLISTGQMTAKKLVNGQKTAQLGPGLRWGDVYDWISGYGLGVVGGRFGPVGVPGLLLGGGINFFGSSKGWSASQVTNFEVVLADGSIVNANAKSHSDLFWALKGGSSNYGIVTRFDVNTFPVTSVFGGQIQYNSTHLDDYLHALAAYISPGGGADDVATSVDPIILVDPSTSTLTCGGFLFHPGDDADPASLSNFTSIPTLYSDVSLRPSLKAAMDETNTPAYYDRTKRELFQVTSLKAVPEAVYLVNQTFTSRALSKLSGTSVALTSTTMQHISHQWLSAARAAGGDAIDLDPANGGFLGVLVHTSWSDAADDDAIHAYTEEIFDEINSKAKEQGIDYPFVYLNDAWTTQSVFPTYGYGKSLPKMQQIAKKYDPSGLYQTLMPGGFKLF